MAWEVYTYGGGEYLRVVFNGVAAIMGHTEYSTLLRIFLIATVLWIIARIAFVTQRPTDMTGLLGVFALLFVAFVPKVDVIIRDRIDPAMGSVVSNVPLGVGFTASFASKAGDWMTRAFEAVLSLPDDLQYQRNGMLFGARLVEASTRFDFTDGRLRENLSSFWRQCVMYDIALGLYSWDDITWDGDLWGFFKANTSVSRMFTYRDAAGNKTLMVCRTGANTVLDADVTAAVDQAMRFYGKRFYEKDPPAAAMAKFAAVLPVSYQYVTGLALSASDIMRQNLMINALRRGIASYATSAGATAAAVDYAIARAEAERRTTFQAMGELALRTLPLLRNIFEALIYGIFPIVLLVAVLAPRIAMVSYLKSLFWIQLWAPLYAILHFGMMFYGQSRGTAGVVGPLGTSALTLATATELGGVLQDMGYIAGYMAMLIPLMSYMLVQTGGALMASVGSSIMMGIQQTAARAADEATMGNIRMGNVALDNINWMKQDTSVLHRSGIATYTDHMGATHTYTPGGLHAVGALRSDVGMNIDMSLAASYARERAHALETSVLEERATARVQALSAAMDRVDQLMASTGTRNVFTEAWSQEDRAAYSRFTAQLREVADQLVEKRGVSREVAEQVAKSVGLSVGLGVSNFGISVGGRAAQEWKELSVEKQRELVETARQQFDKETAQKGVQSLEGLARTVTSADEQYGGRELSEGVKATMRDVLEARESHQQALQERQSYLDGARMLETAGQAVRVELTTAFLAAAERSSEAVRAQQWATATNDPAARLRLARAGAQWAAEIAARQAAGETVSREESSAIAADAIRWAIDSHQPLGAPVRATVEERLAGGADAVRAAYRPAGSEDEVLDRHAQDTGRVLVKAQGQGLGQDRLGQAPLTSRENQRKLRDKVDRAVDLDAPVRTVTGNTDRPSGR